MPILILGLRWIARIWGIGSTLLLLAFVFGGEEHLRFRFEEAIPFLFFPVGVVIGFLVAWKWELAGGLITVGSLTAFYAYMLLVGGRWPGPYFSLFAAPGFIHLICAVQEPCFRLWGFAWSTLAPGTSGDEVQDHVVDRDQEDFV